MSSTFKIGSWNINGIKSIIRKGSLANYISAYDPDILCLSEIRTNYVNLKENNYYYKELGQIYEYTYWNIPIHKKGYSGTAILSKLRPLKYKFYDDEGRITMCEFENFVLFSIYSPNSGEDFSRLSYKCGEWNTNFRKIIQNSFKFNKPLILAGDFNCAHRNLDVYSLLDLLPGCTEEERIDFNSLLNDFNLIDIYRENKPNDIKFTFWSNRVNSRLFNRGMRLDYFLIDRKLKEKINYSQIIDNIKGSDHCPIELSLKFN